MATYYIRIRYDNDLFGYVKAERGLFGWDDWTNDPYNIWPLRVGLLLRGDMYDQKKGVLVFVDGNPAGSAISGSAALVLNGVPQDPKVDDSGTGTLHMSRPPVPVPAPIRWTVSEVS